MSRQIIWSVGLIGGGLLIAVLMVWLRPAPAEEQPVNEAPLVEVAAFEAASGPIPVLGSGTVQARDEVTIGVQVAGRLTYVNQAFREGSSVPAGAVLLRIDPAEYRNDVRMARADVAAQDVSVLQAQEEVTIAGDELRRFAQREQRRSGGVGQAEILPPQELENGTQQASETATTATSGAASSGATSSGLATKEPQLRSAQAARERAAAGLADARLALSRTRVSAPFAGLVRSEDAAIGSLVQPGQALGSIVSTNAYEVRVSLTADEAALIPGLLEGSSARIPAVVTYEYGGRLYRWNAFVDRANAILDSATRNVEVFLRVPSPLSGGRLVAEGEQEGQGDAPPLLLGAFVNAEITGSSLETYAVVPAVAVRPGNEIWVVRDGKLRILPVRVMQRSDELAYIATPSLAEGGQIILNAIRTPIDGMAVRTAGADAE